MINIKHFIIKFLLFALSHAIIFSMQQPFPISAAFNPTKNQVALICSDQSMKIWDITENSIKDISLDSIKTELAGKNIHSIAYDSDNKNNIKIKIYTPSGICEVLENENIVTGKELIFNIKTVQCEQSIDLEKFAQNKRSHNAINIIKSGMTIVAYKEKKRFFNDIVNKNIHSYALQPNNDNQPIVAVGFTNETHLHNLTTYDPFHIFKHQGTNSTTLTFNHDGTQFLLCKNDGSLELYSFYNLTHPLLTFTINQPIKKPEPIIKKPIEGNIIKPKQNNLIKTILFSPLYAFKAFCHNTSFTTKTILTTASLGLIWLYYTKYLTTKK